MTKIFGMLFRFGARLTLVILVLPALYLMEPFYRLRFSTIYTQRIGHLAVNAEIFLRKMQLNGPPKRTFYLFFGWDPANRQLFEMWKRTRGFPVRFVESHLGTRIMFSWRPILSKTRFWEAHRVTATEYFLFNHTEPVLSFTEEEENKGRRLLAEMGIGENDWFVCFHARDANYFRQWRPQLEEHWQKVDFRNADVRRYLKAAEYIISLGGFAVRYGAHVEQALPETRNAKIIDYSTSHRCDFMDIYLAANCRFFIGSCSGPMVIPTLFNIPIVSPGNVPWNLQGFLRDDIALPRLFSAPGEHKPASFLDAQEVGYYDGWSHSSSTDPNMGLYDMLDPDEDDILDACKDMIDHLEGTPPPVGAAELQSRFAAQFFSHAPEYEDGGMIGARFALKYHNLIVPGDNPPRPPSPRNVIAE